MPNNTILLILIIGGTLAIPIDKLLISRYQLQQDGGYEFEYQTSDGIHRQEVAVLEQRLDQEPVLHVYGFYSYLDQTGRNFTVYYEAGEEGSKTRGDIIPLFLHTTKTPSSSENVTHQN